MMDLLKALIKQPYQVIALLVGAVFVALPCLELDKDHHWETHPPNTFLLVGVGIALLLYSAVGFWLSYRSKRAADANEARGSVNLTRVKESDGVASTIVNGCEICVVEGRIEDHAHQTGLAIVLPCNEYFDDRCVGDVKSALGAYVNRVFEGRAEAFVSLIKDECSKQLDSGEVRRKTENELGTSFGPGRCVLLARPLDHSVPVALVSTTTQRAGEGLASRISYLFDGMRELVKRLADARLTEAVMPILGAGHGRIDPPLAFVGLVLALAEAARYGQGGQRLRRVTVVIFKRDANSDPEVDRAIIRRALALIGSRG